MPALDVNGYTSTFRAFANFAQDHIDAGQRKAIVNLAPLGGRRVTLVASQTDKVGGMLLRSTSQERANDAARAVFLRTVIDMFGGESRIPEKVRDALNLQDYGRGQPLTARRIMAVKQAIDESGIPKQRAADMKLNTFVSAEVKAAALELGYVKGELPKLARAAHFLAQANGLSEMDAMREVAQPGSKANRLMNYGGRFLQSAENFAEGMRLLDSFQPWFTDLTDSRGNRSYHTEETLARANTVTKLNTDGFVVGPKAARAFEMFVFEELAVNPDMDLKETDPEKLFGFEHNAASRFVGRGFTTSCLFTVKEIPPEKRRLVFKVFDMFSELSRTADEYRATREGGEKCIEEAYRPVVLARLLRHMDAVEKMDRNGTLTPKSFLKTCFPDMSSAQRGDCDYKAVNEFMGGISHELGLIEEEGGEYADVSGPMPLLMQRTGCTLKEGAKALREGKVLPSVKFFVDASAPMKELDGTTLAGRNQIAGDLYRGQNYSFRGSQDPLMRRGDFGFHFPGTEERIFTDGTEEGRRNITRVADEIEKLCGAVHPQQATSVMFMISQSGMGEIRSGIPQLNLHSNEHSLMDFSFSRDEKTGAVTIRYDSPVELPVRFSWTATVDVNGRVTSTPLTYEKPAAVNTAKARTLVAEAATARGVQLTRDQTSKAVALLVANGTNMYAQNARLLANFIVNLKLTGASARSDRELTAEMAGSIREWRNFEFGQARMPELEAAATDVANNIFAENRLPENRRKFTNNDENIFETMVADAGRNDFTINGQNVPKNAAALIAALKTALPDGKAQKAVSALMNQLSVLFTSFPANHIPYDPVFGRPEGVAGHDLPGAGMLVNRDMTSGRFSESVSGGKSVHYTLSVAEDGRSATLRLDHQVALTMGCGRDSTASFGSCTTGFELQIDLSGEEPVVSGVRFAQKID